MDKTKRGGVSFCTVLLIVFVVLKLTGNITWSWIWVLSPFWIPLVLTVVLVLIAICSTKIENTVNKRKAKKGGM